MVSWFPPFFKKVKYSYGGDQVYIAGPGRGPGLTIRFDKGFGDCIISQGLGHLQALRSVFVAAFHVDHLVIVLFLCHRAFLLW